MDQVYDVIRKQWVYASPEEVIRQKWIDVMLNQLSFPKELLVVEKQIQHLPHLDRVGQTLPDRRIDLMAYHQTHPQILPLLLMECKCIALNQKTLLQVAGYNQYIQAPFMAIANEEEILMGFMEPDGSLTTIDFLPAYSLLLKSLKR